MPARAGDTALMPGGRIARKPKVKVRRKKTEVAGPYRDQSSNPKIHAKANPREHRRVPEPKSKSSRRQHEQAAAFSVPSLGASLQQGARRRGKLRREAAKTTQSALRLLRDTPVLSRQAAYSQARYSGRKPSPLLSRYTPPAVVRPKAGPYRAQSSNAGIRAKATPAEFADVRRRQSDFRKAQRGYLEHLSEHENLKQPEDLTNLITIGIPGALGVGQVVKAGLKTGVRALAEEAVTQAAGKTEGTVAGAAAKAALPKTAARATRNAVRRVLGKETIKAPARAEQAFVAKVPGTAALKAATGQSLPVVRGHEKALVEEPGKTLKTTARIAPGVLTTPIGIAANVGTSVGRLASSGAHAAGIPGFKSYSGSEIFDPTKATIDEQVAFAKEVEKVVTSNDPEYVKRQVENHLGLLLPAMAAPLVARAFKPGYARMLERLRRNREVDRALKGTQRRPPGEKAQHVTAISERRSLRKAESVHAATTKQHAEVETYARSARVLKLARKAKGPVETIREIPKGRLAKGKRGHTAYKLQINPGDAVGFLARHGISRNLDDALRQIKHLHDQLDPAVAAELPRKQINTLDLTTYLLKHPAVLKDENLWGAVDAYKAQAHSLTESETARVQPVMQAHADESLGQRNPAIRHFDRVPHDARPHTTATTRSELRKEISADRQKLKRAAAKGQKLKVRKLARQIADKRTGLYSDLTKTERSQLVEDLAEQGITDPAEIQRHVREARAQKAANADKALEREYLDQAKGLIAHYRYEQPAYASHADVRSKGSPSVSATGGQLPKVPAGTKARTGYLQEIGAIDESLPALLRESIRVPVARQHIFTDMRRFINEHAVSFNGKTEITSREAGRLMDEGHFDPRHNILIPRQLYNRAFAALHKGDESGIAALREATAKDGQQQIVANLHFDKGRKYVVVPREAATEFFAQTERLGGVQAKVRGINNATSRAILGTSPAWAAMQLLAEGTQASAAVNPYRLYRGLKAFRDLPPEKQWSFQAFAGETPGVILSPKDVQLSLHNGDMTNAADAFGVANKTTLGRGLKNLGTAELLGLLDRKKGGLYRRAIAAGAIDRELNSKLYRFTGGMRSLWRAENKVTDHLKGKPLSEQLAWFVDHPEHMQRIQTYLDDVMGNWNALTRHERTASTVVMFYPFLRMSLRWLLWSFPKQHPIKASIAYYLGQQNADQLHKLLHGDPSFFNWAQVPLHTGKGGEPVGLVDLGRMAPGANALVQAFGGASGGPTGNAALQITQPVISAVATAVTGVSPLSGRQAGGSGWQALGQLAALPLPFRVAGEVPGLDKLVPKGGVPALIPGQGPSGSPTGEAFRKEGSEGPTALLRKSVLPVIPKPLDQERRKTQLSKLTDAKYKNPVPSPFTAQVVKALFEGPGGKVNQKLARDLAAQRERAQAAGEKATSLENKILGGNLGNLTPEQSEWLKIITGGVFIPLDPAEEAKIERAGRGTTIGGSRIGGGAVKSRRGGTHLATGQTSIGGVPVGRPEGKRKVRPKGTRTTIGGVPVG